VASRSELHRKLQSTLSQAAVNFIASCSQLRGAVNFVASCSQLCGKLQSTLWQVAVNFVASCSQLCGKLQSTSWQVVVNFFKYLEHPASMRTQTRHVEMAALLRLQLWQSTSLRAYGNYRSGNHNLPATCLQSTRKLSGIS